jgi:hypothetical protein
LVQISHIVIVIYESFGPKRKGAFRIGWD